MLEDFKVICGISLKEEIQKFHEWTTKKHLENQASVDSEVISMDVDVKASYYDVMRMAGKIVISGESQSFQIHLDDQPVSRLMEDC